MSSSEDEIAKLRAAAAKAREEAALLAKVRGSFMASQWSKQNLDETQKIVDYNRNACTSKISCTDVIDLYILLFK